MSEDLQYKLEELTPVINEIRNDAHALHASVNHAYDRIRPGFLRKNLNGISG